MHNPYNTWPIPQKGPSKILNSLLLYWGDCYCGPCGQVSCLVKLIQLLFSYRKWRREQRACYPVYEAKRTAVSRWQRHNEVDIPNIATNQSAVLTRRNPSLSLTHVHLDTSPCLMIPMLFQNFLQIPPPAINHVLAKIKLCTDALGDKREFS